MRTRKHYVGDKLWSFPRSLVPPGDGVEGGFCQSGVGVICSNHQIHSLSKQGTVFDVLGFMPCPPSTQQRKDEPCSSSVTKEKPCLLPSWYSKLEADVKGGFFSLTFSQIIPLLTQWEWKNSSKILTINVLSGEATSRCKSFKANASSPYKRIFEEKAMKGQQPKSTSKWP